MRKYEWSWKNIGAGKNGNVCAVGDTGQRVFARWRATDLPQPCAGHLIRAGHDCLCTSSFDQAIEWLKAHDILRDVRGAVRPFLTDFS